MSSATFVWGDVSNALHVERMRHHRRLGVGETLETDGAFALVTGPTSNIENGIVCGRDELAPGEAARLISWVRERNVPAAWMQPDGDVSEALDAELFALGCREETTGVDMGARIAELELPASTPGIEIAPVREPTELSTWIDIAARCGFFDEPVVQEGQRQLYAAAGFDGPFQHWLARRGGRAVGIATAFFGAEALLLEHVAVLPEHRGRGIGSALVGVRVQEAARRGLDVAVLRPTPDSQVFFERLGFSHTRVRPRRWYYL